MSYTHMHACMYIHYVCVQSIEIAPSIMIGWWWLVVVTTFIQGSYNL